MSWYIVLGICGAAVLLQLAVCLFRNAAACAVNILCHLGMFAAMLFLQADAEQIFLCALASLTAYFVLEKIVSALRRRKG